MNEQLVACQGGLPFLVVDFVVVVLFYEQFCDEDPDLVFLVYEGQVVLPGLLL
jgi:hypothetical protein